MLSARAMATLGVGYGAKQMAALGLSPVVLPTALEGGGGGGGMRSVLRTRASNDLFGRIFEKFTAGKKPKKLLLQALTEPGLSSAKFEELVQFLSDSRSAEVPAERLLLDTFRAELKRIQIALVEEEAAVFLLLLS